MKIFRLILFILFVHISGISFAQLNLNGHFYGQDALRYSVFQTTGSARIQGMGGNSTPLGGDISSAFNNPAGLGFYNRSEFVLTPSIQTTRSNTVYLGESAEQQASSTKINQVGIVFNQQGVGTRKKRASFAIGYNRLIDFSSDFRYQGTNQRSSITDFFAEKVTAENVNTTILESEFDAQTGLAETASSMYYQAFLIDPFGTNNVYVSSELSTPVEQQGRVRESGGLSQTNFSYGVNFDDALYLGGSLGILRLNYTQFSDHVEQFPNGNLMNEIGFFDELQATGGGINLTLGAIYKLNQSLQIGVDFTTPTSMRVNETYQSGVTIDPIPGIITTTFSTIETVPNDFTYRVNLPLRANVGSTIFLPKKVGLVTASLGYVGYNKMKVQDPENARWTELQNREIMDRYQDVMNVQVGSEIRLGVGRIRGGVQYLANPVKNDLSNTQNQTNITLGVGIRKSNFFLDLAGLFGKINRNYTPYELQTPTDYGSVENSINYSRFLISGGIFF